MCSRRGVTFPSGKLLSASGLLWSGRFKRADVYPVLLSTSSSTLCFCVLESGWAV